MLVTSAYLPCVTFAHLMCSGAAVVNSTFMGMVESLLNKQKEGIEYTETEDSHIFVM